MTLLGDTMEKANITNKLIHEGPKDYQKDPKEPTSTDINKRHATRLKKSKEESRQTPDIQWTGHRTQRRSDYHNEAGPEYPNWMEYRVNFRGCGPPAKANSKTLLQSSDIVGDYEHVGSQGLEPHTFFEYV